MGYEVAIHFEEFILILTGIFIGIVIEALISRNFIRNLYKIEDFGRSKLQMIRVTKEGKSKYIIGFKTLSEAFMQVLIFLAHSLPINVSHEEMNDVLRYFLLF